MAAARWGQQAMLSRHAGDHILVASARGGLSRSKHSTLVASDGPPFSLPPRQLLLWGSPPRSGGAKRPQHPGGLTCQLAEMKRLALGTATAAAAAAAPRAAPLRPPLPPAAPVLHRAAQHANLAAPGHSLQLSSATLLQRSLRYSRQVGHGCAAWVRSSAAAGAGAASPSLLVCNKQPACSTLALHTCPVRPLCLLQQARRQRLQMAAAAGGRPDVLASRDQEEPVAARRSKDEEDQMLRSLDRVEVRACRRCCAQGVLLHKVAIHVARCTLWQRPCQCAAHVDGTLVALPTGFHTVYRWQSR